MYITYLQHYSVYDMCFWRESWILMPGKPRTRWQTKALPENLDPEWKEERESLGSNKCHQSKVKPVACWV